MEEIKKYKIALHLYNTGKVDEALRLYLELYTSSNQSIKLQAILGCIVLLDPILEGEKIINFCTEGIELAQKLNDFHSVSYLCGMKVTFLSEKISYHIYLRKNLFLHHDWKAFSLKRDEDEYDFLSKEIENYRKEVLSLLNKSIDINNNLNDTNLKSLTFLSKGDSSCKKYFDYKLENIKRSPPLWVLNILRYFNLLDYFLYDINSLKKLKLFINECENNYMEAFKLYDSQKDKDSKVNALYNLAVHFNSFNKFHKAKKYLFIAEKIARENNLIIILDKIPELKQRIKNKNRDIPNYIEEIKFIKKRK